MSIFPEVQSAIEECVSHKGASVIDLQTRGTRANRVYEVFIDSESGVTLEFCSEVSRDIKTVLDRIETASQYRLIVSSPGFERLLRFPWQFGKHAGKLMRIRRFGEATAEVTGRLVSVDALGIVLRDESSKEEKQILFGEIGEARLRAPW